MDNSHLVRPEHELDDEDRRRLHVALTTLAACPGFREKFERDVAKIEREGAARRAQFMEDHKAHIDATRALRGESADIIGFTRAAASSWSLAKWGDLVEILRTVERSPGAGGPARQPTTPVLHELTQSYISPGDAVGLYGEFLGSRVFMTLDTGIIELATGASATRASQDSQSTYYREAILDPNLTGVRPFDGHIWVQSADGSLSNTMPIRFQPVIEHWMAVFSDELKSWGAGGKKDSIAFAGGMLGDVSQTATMYLWHRYDGWSELRAPFAGGPSLSQGYHIGNAWSDYSAIRIFCSVTSPRGIIPPPLPGAPWSGPSTIPWLPTW